MRSAKLWRQAAGLRAAAQDRDPVAVSRTTNTEKRRPAAGVPATISLVTPLPPVTPHGGFSTTALRADAFLSAEPRC
ncbi:hypothetical protein PF005_g25929 [Phytophthora fragariae]|uniref:Uncharacterized protein n=1 Tax=Phytophthora fragariae TaxID=53985 RepID=A0A6A3QBQ1_9STRA|nr:hypothetical protein PF003_g17237 [Phytophthora fragariae]KAE8923309.1 hypothetical protein PF009_g26441 [Phytophthora fragariae]KAE8974833.1 hypothetical protein PF011_g24716 [Phytophthora fragariae]KAE9072892.1 hypothetical protein PF010_g25302 [Phytophthora fragariae]KAE9072955.1 hypothetical protein PF007_g25992 [Phytophthora fragariae]